MLFCLCYTVNLPAKCLNCYFHSWWRLTLQWKPRVSSLTAISSPPKIQISESLGIIIHFDFVIFQNITSHLYIYIYMYFKHSFVQRLYSQTRNMSLESFMICNIIFCKYHIFVACLVMLHGIGTSESLFYVFVLWHTVKWGVFTHITRMPLTCIQSGGNIDLASANTSAYFTVFLLFVWSEEEYTFVISQNKRTFVISQNALPQMSLQPQILSSKKPVYKPSNLPYQNYFSILLELKVNSSM